MDPLEKIAELEATIEHLMKELKERDAKQKRDLDNAFRNGYSKGKEAAEVAYGL